MYPSSWPGMTTETLLQEPKIKHALTRARILAPNPERFLRGAVGDREQHRLLRRVVRVVLPRRHHEHVPRAPFEHLAVDRCAAPALGADEDGAVGRAVRLALEALREHRE